jgi:hypothetical protein
MERLAPPFNLWIPELRVLHPYPQQCFVATHPKWELYVSNAGADLCRAISNNHPYCSSSKFT